MTRVHNFSAGPGVLPESVLQQCQEAIWEFSGSGLGLLETSHRSPPFEAVIQSAVARLGRLLGVSETHEILFLTGGASAQFYMVPMNLLRQGRATYLETGTWSTKAIREARRFGQIDVPFTSTERVPGPTEWGDVPPGTAYLHYTSNNTIMGTEYHHLPRTDVPLVVDASSNMLSRPWPDAAHDILYAGAQKNLGPAGVTVVAIRRELLDACDPELPTLLRYPVHAEKDSMFNTPPTFPIFVVERVCAWIEEQGGLPAIGARNDQKAQKLYQILDGSEFWQGKASPDSRSRMNITFSTGDPALDTRLHTAAAKEGLSGLKGHRSVGGLRASIYNACPPEAVDALADFMTTFERTHG
ncbi:MAG: 3-phosphoserine/phosphohydroxythreonine transaminase [Deltaproteobacteria bacterium]|nr:MAG: 3-phosphoserine/phosphohydroxythreonine transaminase [Deltaproteobacteria bacterium]